LVDKNLGQSNLSIHPPINPVDQMKQEDELVIAALVDSLENAAVGVNPKGNQTFTSLMGALSGPMSYTAEGTGTV
jgi:hypothetical protein